MNRHERRKQAKRSAQAAPPQPRLIRPDRVEAFTDWIEDAPTDVPIMECPGSLLFLDLSDAEIMAARDELGHRAEHKKAMRADLVRLAAGIRA